ncbi:MAG: hypothetical protein HY652_00160 [Acidobacteria bacterium]|nr:hypothetical protein [Acidobacteriota bacterium]
MKNRMARAGIFVILSASCLAQNATEERIQRFYGEPTLKITAEGVVEGTYGSRVQMNAEQWQQALRFRGTWYELDAGSMWQYGLEKLGSGYITRFYFVRGTVAVTQTLCPPRGVQRAVSEVLGDKYRVLDQREGKELRSYLVESGKVHLEIHAPGHSSGKGDWLQDRTVEVSIVDPSLCTRKPETLKPETQDSL